MFSLFYFSDWQPLETRLISETSGVCQPEQVAKIVVRDAVVSGNDLGLVDSFSNNLSHRFSIIPLQSQQGNFTSSIGPDGYMLSALTCGMSPVTSITEGLQQVQPTITKQPNLIHSSCILLWFYTLIFGVIC